MLRVEIVVVPEEKLLGVSARLLRELRSGAPIFADFAAPPR